MTQLRKGMYSDKKYKPGLFGLHCGQMRGRKKRISKNCGWYNKCGEKLGWGDLSVDDFKRIASALKEGQLFIILTETSSYWKFVTFRGSDSRRRIVVSSREKAPGIEYVRRQAMYIIGQNKLYIVDWHGSLKIKSYRSHGLRFKVLDREAVKKLMAKKR